MRAKLCLPILAVIIVVGGVFCLLFPCYQTQKARAEDASVIEGYQAYVSQQRQEAEPTEEATQEAEPTQRPFAALWEACISYNQSIYETRQADLNAESNCYAPIDLAAYGWELEEFAYLSIPSIELEIPLYLGASNRNLNKGGAILGQTSLPIGGVSSCCVIAGHRSWNNAIRFRDIENLHPGDTVYITNPWETLSYTVVQTMIIPPNNIEKIKIQEGQDLLKIFTCAANNSQRYLIICARQK